MEEVVKREMCPITKGKGRTHDCRQVHIPRITVTAGKNKPTDLCVSD